MPLKRRPFSVFTLSFLDVMCCGFGAVVLLFMILKHEQVERERVRKVDLSVEVDALQAQLDATRAETAAAQAKAKSIDEQIAELLAQSATARA